MKTKDFSEDEIQSIEREIDSLNFASKPENKINYYKDALSKFEKYLKDTLSFTFKRHSTTLYGGLGLVFGMLFGIVFLFNWERNLGISMGLIFGMLVGSAIGRFFDAKALREDRVLEF